MARKKYDEVTDNHERWLISYADFITLLFAFFVVMYAISVVNEGKYRVFSDALGSAFGGRAAPKTALEAQPAIALPNLAARKRAEAMRRERERLTTLARGVATRPPKALPSASENTRYLPSLTTEMAYMTTKNANSKVMKSA